MAITRVYYCSNCKKFYHGDSSTCDLICTTCGRDLDFVNIDYSTFAAMSKEEREIIQKQYDKPQNTGCFHTLPFFLLYAILYGIFTTFLNMVLGIRLGGIPTIILLLADAYFCKFLYKRYNEKTKNNTSNVGKYIKSFLRSFSSVVLSGVIWYILYIAFLLAVAFLFSILPAIPNVLDFLSGFLHFEHLYMVVGMGVPAIVPAFIVRHIMKEASSSAQKWTLISSVVLIGMIVFFFPDESFNLIDKIEGIFGISIAYYAFGKE